ncbi:glycosyl transferase family 1 [Zobellella endophytica]|uniref:Glycosyl transferase family 1 n=1 Tax=Zobellella endophytica TaxID=2116700 RepID=A0A2P7RD00_9GAMM|nr:rhamnan synthesis F family protein [Zobellella endophytica]PSJ48032.1 glycosyl transferase family 1 [Zobellella endophytica]
MLKKAIKFLKQKKRKRKENTASIFQQAVDLGLFNSDWYQSTYSGRFDSARDAFDDYLHKSRFAPVNPSPAFDGEIYQRLNMDVYTSVQSPLKHYILSGRHEGRFHVGAVTKWHPKEPVSTKRKLTEQASQQKVAICLHIFYEDFIDRFADALRRFPMPVDVFITLADGKLARKATSVFQKIGQVRQVQVRAVPNRGRNFGPLLVEYAQELRGYDLFCHLHSKKSLYSGKEQSQWSEYLTEYLLRDPAVINRVLNAFADNEELGVYYPTSFWMMPNWVNHWTVNKPHTGEWLEQFGMSLDSDFINYPVGGMFWARPKALKELLAREYQYEDFPAEPLPNDGSSLHALERLVGLLAEKNGYKQFYYYPPTGRFTTDKSYCYIQYHNSARNAFDQIKNHELISFDVFDTLVRRRYFAPDYAKLKLGARLAAEGLVDNAHAFVGLRNEAEFELRKEQAFKGDVRIDAIYQRLVQRLGLDETRAEPLMQQEFELDLDMIEGKDEMVDIFNDLYALGRTLWVVSDTYYTREQIGLMLRKAGVTAPFRLLVSSEEQKRKDNGTMWHFVKSELQNMGSPSFLHIGDNVVADAQLPGDLGLGNFHILNPHDKWHAFGLPSVLRGKDSLNEQEILKWGPLIFNLGRSPFIGE